MKPSQWIDEWLGRTYHNLRDQPSPFELAIIAYLNRRDSGSELYGEPHIWVILDASDRVQGSYREKPNDEICRKWVSDGLRVERWLRRVG